VKVIIIREIFFDLEFWMDFGGRERVDIFVFEIL